MPNPSISIITPTLNGGAFFPLTLRSILSQTGDFDLQWIVIDGGSTDGTLELLQQTNDPRLKWISGKDAGQTAAVNRGLAMASGEIVGWLNSDDLFTPGALDVVVRAMNANSSVNWVVGRCEMIDKNGNITRQKITEYKNRLLDRFNYRRLLRMNMVSQPAVFWRNAFGKEIGPLDEELHYTMDYDLWLRMARQQAPLILDRVLARFRVHADSKSRGGNRDQFEEGYRVACRYAQGDAWSRRVHRWNVEKIVWAYRAMRLVGR